MTLNIDHHNANLQPKNVKQHFADFRKIFLTKKDEHIRDSSKSELEC